MPRSRAGAMVLLAALAASGCGMRVSPQRMAAARQGQAARTLAADANGQAGTSPGGVGDVSGGSSGSAGSSAAAGGVGPAGAGGATQPASAVPAGGNGGATDVGVTADTVTIGNVSTLSGPVPGLFQGAVVGTQAFVAYQNSLGGVFGRKLKLDIRDDQFDSGQNRAQTLDLLDKVFAMVGSFSLYDDSAETEMANVKLPDVGEALGEARKNSPLNFSVNPVRPGAPTGAWNFFKAKFPGAVGAVGALYSDVPAATTAFNGAKAAMQSVGYKIVYERGFQATETDFTADVVRMRQSNVKLVFNMADVKSVARVAKAMAQQNYKPDAYVSYGPAYDASLMPLAGPAAEGTLNITTQAMYLGEDASAVPEVALFDQWLQKVKPGYKPDLYAAYGWASARMFAQALQAAGPKVTRGGIADALRKIDSFDSNGLIAPAGPASKRPSVCFIIVRVHNAKFERWESPAPGFRCNDGGYFYLK
ncbi:MAG: hypothetical protein JWO37_2139 [Acidimicrobiales bacterium]|jgi:ABC-type branched-subunit amino acid transport system substrate-binding protein|nr:hypothetical protein [Acidimicrobiales bacterium]